jgi:hypothetical protein
VRTEGNLLSFHSLVVWRWTVGTFGGRVRNPRNFDLATLSPAEIDGYHAAGGCLRSLFGWEVAQGDLYSSDLLVPRCRFGDGPAVGVRYRESPSSLRQREVGVHEASSRL